MTETRKNTSPMLILASSSPRRRDLLTQAGYRFTVVAPPVEEPTRWPEHTPPAALAEALAYFKARSVAENHPHATILGADTICACHGHILGKPADANHARRMLHQLSHNPHVVITGLAVLQADRRRITSDTTRVVMTPMTPQDIESYIVSGEWQGKAGAYAIQESADQYVQRLDGSFSNVVGLPTERLHELIGPPR